MFRRSVVLFVALCLAAALLPAAVQAHSPRSETYNYEVDVPKTKEVPVYTWVSLRVRVAPFTKTVPVYGPGTVTECVTINEQHVCYGVPGIVQVGTKTVPVYNYKTGEPFRVQTGTKIETYTVTETRTGTRRVHTPHTCTPPGGAARTRHLRKPSPEAWPFLYPSPDSQADMPGAHL